MLLHLALLFLCCMGGKAVPFLTEEENSNVEDVELNCFEHVTAESTSSYQAGEVWKVCLKGPTSGGSGSVDAVAVRVAESGIKQESEYKALRQHTSPRLLQVANTSVSIIIHVDDKADGAVNTSLCEPSSPSTGCTLRSALQLCAQSLISVSNSCTIMLPPHESLVLNASLGELTMIDAVGTLRIEGAGCAITSSNDYTATGNNIRFLNVSIGTAESMLSSDSTSSSALVFHLANMTLRGFGAPSLKGGTIYLDNLLGGSIENLTCLNSRGSYGGALFMDRSQQFQIRRSRFEHNTAAGDGGALYLESYNQHITVSECEVSHNTAQGVIDDLYALGGGAAVYSHNAYISFNSNMFFNNSAARGGGLGFYDSNTFARVFKCLIEGNKVSINGGGMYMVFDNMNMHIEDCFFMNNSAEYGGAIRFWTGSYDVYLLRCQFIGNTAVVAGGGMHVYGNNFNMRVESCTFSENYCLDYGAGVAINSGNYYMNFTNCVFNNNSALNYGGAISLLSDNRYLVVKQCSFEANSAGLAGGAFYSLVLNTFATFDKSVFLANAASLYGGGIYFGNDHQSISFLSCVMAENEAESGAGVFISGFNLAFTFDFCVIEQNVALNIGGGVYCLGEDVTFVNCMIHNNSADISGGIYYQSGSERPSQKCSIVHSTFIGNMGYTGTGGISIENVEHVEVRDCSFQKNYAQYGSGGLSIIKCNMVNVSDSHFVSNKCPSNGGGLLLLDTANLLLHNATFASNVAIRGGGLWMESCTQVEVSHCLLRNNTASLNGGCMWMNHSSEVLIASSVFENNRALTSSGSVLWATKSEPLELDLNFFAGNKAVVGGGTVFFLHSDDMAEPIGLRSDRNTFTETNIANYGPFWATQGTNLYTPTLTLNVTVYDQNLEPIVVYLKDYYGQVVLSEANGLSTFVVLRLLLGQNCDGQEGYLTGDFTEPFIEGKANVDSVQAQCAPGYNLDLAIVSGNGDIAPLLLNLAFRLCETGEYYADRMCKPCRNGTYSNTNPEGLSLEDIREVNVCRDCPSEASSCFADTMVLKKGFWRIGPAAAEVLACPMDEKSCLGGEVTGAELCAKGYEGPLCAVCDSGYHRSASGTSCDSCNESSSWLDAFTITLLVMLVLFLGVSSFIVRKVIIRKEKIENIDDFFGLCLVRIGVLKMQTFIVKKVRMRKKVQKIRKHVMARLKIYIAFFQILSVLSYVLDFQFPVVFNHIVNLFRAFVNLSISGSTVVNCSMGSRLDFIDKLIFDTLYPLVAVMIIGSACVVHLSRIPASDIERKDKIRANYMFAFLLFSYMILPFTSSTIFQTFSCTNVDPDDVDSDTADMYMTADYSVSCESNRYRFGLTYAICAIVVYPIGVPALYFRLLYSHKEDISSRYTPIENKTAETERLVRLRPFIFLFDNYKCDYWYWEVVETLYRLALTGLLVLVVQGSSLQIVVGFCFAVFFFLCYQHFTPFQDPSLQHLQHISLFQVASIFFIALNIKAGFVDKNNLLISMLLVIAIFLNFLIDFVSLIWRKFLFSICFTPLEVRDTSLGGSTLSESMLMGMGFSSDEFKLEEGGKGSHFDVGTDSDIDKKGSNDDENNDGGTNKNVDDVSEDGVVLSVLHGMRMD